MIQGRWPNGCPWVPLGHRSFVDRSSSREMNPNGPTVSSPRQENETITSEPSIRTDAEVITPESVDLGMREGIAIR